MIVAIWQNGNSVAVQPVGAHLIVQQMGAQAFEITDGNGEVLMTNLRTYQQANAFAQAASGGAFKDVAAGLGVLAFTENRMRVPSQDVNFCKLLARHSANVREFGASLPLLDAWLAAWDRANIENASLLDLRTEAIAGALMVEWQTRDKRHAFEFIATANGYTFAHCYSGGHEFVDAPE